MFTQNTGGIDEWTTQASDAEPIKTETVHYIQWQYTVPLTGDAEIEDAI